MIFKIPNIQLKGALYSADELASRAAGALEYFQRENIQQGDLVLVDSSIGPDFFSWALACFLTNRIFVPISSKVSESERNALFSKYKINFFINFSPPMRAKPDAILSLVEKFSFEEKLDNPWACIFSSGSTGAPKLVVLTKRNFLASTKAHIKHHGDQTRWLASLPLHHIGGLSIFTRSLLSAQDFFYDDQFHINSIIFWVDHHAITHLSFVPTQLFRALKDEQIALRLAKLRGILLGGAAASEELLQLADKRGLCVLTSYGLTESCSQIVTSDYGKRVVGTAGHALQGVELRLSAGGEILISGEMITPGYLVESGKTSNIKDQNNFFATGDFGALNVGGELQIFGRADDLIISGGVNIYPQEIENALLLLPEIVEARAVGIASEEWGQKIVLAVETELLMNKEQQATLREKIETFLRTKLSPHKIPKEIVFFEKLPRTENQKIIRKKVVELIKNYSPSA